MEMDVFSTDKIFLFIAFVVPGFIAMKTYELLTPSRYIDSSKQIIDAITYSCINYSILLFPIYYLEISDFRHSNKGGYVLCWSLMILSVGYSLVSRFSGLGEWSFAIDEFFFAASVLKVVEEGF